MLFQKFAQYLHGMIYGYIFSIMVEGFQAFMLVGTVGP